MIEAILPMKACRKKGKDDADKIKILIPTVSLLYWGVRAFNTPVLKGEPSEMSSV